MTISSARAENTPAPNGQHEPVSREIDGQAASKARVFLESMKAKKNQ